MKSLSSKTYQCGVTIQGLTTLSGTVYLTGITNTASWDHVIVGTTAQGQIYTRTYAQFMGDVATGISLSSYVTGSGTTNYLPKFTGASALGNSQIFDNGTNVGIGTASPTAPLTVAGTTDLAWAASTSKLQISRSSTVARLQNYENGSASTNIALQWEGGNVGIGTTSPGYKLDVNGSSAFRNDMYVISTSTYWYNGTSYFQATNSSDVGILKMTNNTSPIALQPNGGNVGIGTTSPSSALDVSLSSGATSGIRFKGYSDASTPYLLSLGTQTYQDQFQIKSVNGLVTMGIVGATGGNPDLAFQTNTTERMRITSGGSLLIGSTTQAYNPQTLGYLFGVKSNTTQTFISIAKSGQTLDSGGMIVGLDTTTGYVWIRENIDLTFGNNNTERMRILSNGNLGIGTTSPTQKLSVQGNTDLGNSYGSTTSSTYTTRVSGYAMRYDASNRYGNYGVLILNADSGWTASARRFMLTSGLDVNKFAIIRSVDATTDPLFGDGGAISSGTADFVINSNGLVGIGTTSPNEKLQVAGNINAYVNGGIDAGLFASTSAGSTTIALRSNGITHFNGGNVGIGTTSPSHKLHLYGASDQLIKVENTGTYLMYAGLISNEGYIGSTNATPLGFYTNNVNRLYITTAGNVGIGTTSPAANLHIQGSNAKIRLTGDTHTSIELEDGGTGDPGYLKTYYYGSLVAQVGAGGTFFNTGDVGIGTSSPTTKLHVSAGNFLISGTAIGGGADANSGLRIVAPISTTHYNWMLGAQQNINSAFEITPSTTVGGTTFSTPTAVFLQNGNVGIGTTSPSTKLDVSGVITATGGNSTNWNTAYSWGNHASASYVPQARTLTINGTSYDLSANRTWTITTATPGGSNTQFQYNSSGTLAGASALTYDSGTNRVGINQASPGYDLDVNGQVRVQDKLRVGTVNSGNGVVHMSSTATINASATTIVWAQNVSVGMCAFIEYYILNNNSLTDQRAGTIIVTWNQSGTPTITHTETTTPDIGSTVTVNFTSSLVGSDARINAVNSSANPYTMVMSYKYF